MTIRKARPITEVDKMAPKMVNAGVILDRESERRTESGQRRINLIWESTQSLIAVAVTCAIISSVFMEATSPELSNAFFLVVGFYFGRTNHTKVGGVASGELGR